MAKQKLTELPLASTANLEDLLYVVQTTDSKAANIATVLGSGSTAQIKEAASNLYFTNTRARAAITVYGSASYNTISGVLIVNNVAQEYVANINGANGQVIITTFHVPEGANLYYTNTRVHANIAPLLTTANVTEVTNQYFTNARVFANVQPVFELKSNVTDLTTANVAELNNLYYTNNRVWSNVEPVMVLKADLADLTTANVAELTNLYFTNARVWSNVQPVIDTKANISDLTTANVIELDNLYFTNTRVWANVQPVIDTKANVVDLTTSNVAEGTNQYFTNARVFANVQHVFDLKANVVDLTTANVAELTNLYFTNARVFANVQHVFELKANLADLTTSNIAEGSNQYFTNVRVRQAVSSGDSTIIYDEALGTFRANLEVISGNANLNISMLAVTDDINEGSVNLYFTNNRVLSNVTKHLTVLESNIIPKTGKDVYLGTASNKIANLHVRNLHVDASTIFIGTLSIKDTAGTVTITGPDGNPAPVITDSGNVTETTKLFFTNARVWANVQPVIDTKANVRDLTTSNVAELNNLYYTNNRVWSNVEPTIRLKSNVADLTTANVAELTNLYFTNARAIAAFSSGNGIALSNIGVITANVTENNIVTFTNKLIDVTIASNNKLRIQGQDISSYTGSGPVMVFDTLPTLNGFNIGNGSGLTVDGGTGSYYWAGQSGVAAPGDKKAGVYHSSPTSNNAIFTFGVNGGGYMSVGVEGSLFIGTANPSNDGGLNTSYPGWLVVQSGGKFGGDVNTLGALKFDSAVNGYIQFYNGTIQNTAFTLQHLNTSNVVEGNNLYYSNARVWSNIEPVLGTYYTNVKVWANVEPVMVLKANISDLTTANVFELTNQYFTNARVFANVQPVFELKANVADLTTSNVSEGVNQYFTNTRVYDNVITIGFATMTYVNNAVANLVNSAPEALDTLNELALALGNDSSFATTVTNSLATKAPLTSLTTANVSELTNLYFTNTRVWANVQPVIDTKANVADLTTSNVTEGNNLYYTNARVAANITTILTNGFLTDSIFGNVFAGNIMLTGRIIGDGSGLVGVAPNLWTYGGNILASNIEVTGNVSASNVNVGNVYANRYYGDGSYLTGIQTSLAVIARVAILESNIALKANLVDLNTSNVVEGNNLYYTNTRVHANIAPLLTTANVSEVNNLYFTNTRARAAISAGNNISIDDNGVISSSLLVSSNVNLDVGNVTVTGRIVANNIISSGTGVPTLESSSSINLSANNAVVITRSVLRMASFTNGEIANLAVLPGDIVFNSSNNKFQGYVANGWVDLH